MTDVAFGTDAYSEQYCCASCSQDSSQFYGRLQMECHTIRASGLSDKLPFAMEIATVP